MCIFCISVNPISLFFGINETVHLYEDNIYCYLIEMYVKNSLPFEETSEMLSGIIVTHEVI